MRPPRRPAVALLGTLLLAACGTQTVTGQGSAGGPAATASVTGTRSEPSVVLRFRPVLQTTAAPPGTQAGAGTLVPSPGPGTPVTQEQAAAQLATLACGGAGSSPADRPADYVAACSDDGTSAYLLGPAFVDGADVTSARARQQETTGSWAVELTFDARAQSAIAAYTAAHIGEQVAFTGNGRVLAAPVIQGEIDGPVDITGTFTQDSARRLARELGGG